MLVGKIIGKTAPEWFQFEVSNVIKKMDFIATRDPEKHWVLGRIEGIIQERNKTLARVSVIGYFDKRGIVRMPKMPFKPGSFVYTADDGLIKRVLSLKASGLYVGLLDGSESLKVNLNPEKLMSKHLAVLAKTGFGKSYFIGVLLEEFMENKIPAVIIDPHGEYSSLQYSNKREDEIKYMSQFEIRAKEYRKELQIFSLEKNLKEGTKKLKFRDKLTYQEVFEMLPFRLTGNQLSVIYSALGNIGKTTYTIEDIKKEVELQKSRARWKAISALDYLESSGLFDSSGYTKPSDLVKKGKLTIIDLKGLDPDIQQLVVYKIAKDLFNARKMNRIPQFLFVVEEAQNFCPERGFGEAISSRILRTIASEGRKFGMGLSIISQRPARVDKNVLSQCNTQAYLRINNPNDLRAIMDSMEGITKGVMTQIKSIPVGTGVIVGLIDQPLIVNIRVKRTNHGGAITLKPKKPKSNSESDILYFYPKFLEDDIKKKIRKKFQQFKLIYYPMWRLACRFETPDGPKEDNIFMDGISGELVFSDEKGLVKTEGLPKLFNLEIKEKAILLYLTTYGISTLEQLSKKLKIPDNKVLGIIKSLEERKLITEENEEFRSSLSLNFEEIIEKQITENLVSYKYAGDIIPFKVDRSSTDGVLSLFNPNAVERKMCFYPYWVVFYDDGNIDVIDAMTGDKDEFIIKEDFIDNLPL